MKYLFLLLIFTSGCSFSYENKCINGKQYYKDGLVGNYWLPSQDKIPCYATEKDVPK